MDRWAWLEAEVQKLHDGTSDESTRDAYAVVLEMVHALKPHAKEEEKILRLLLRIEQMENRRLREEAAAERRARERTEMLLRTMSTQLYHGETAKSS